MGDIGRREGRSAFRKLIQDSVPEEFQTRVHQLFESVVFSVEPILRDLEYLEVRYGSGAPTISDYPDEGFGIFIDEGAGSAWVVLNWQKSFYIIGGSGAGSLPAHTHDHLTEITNVGVNTHSQIDTHITAVNAHIADSAIHFLEGSIDHTAIQNIGVNTHAQIDAALVLASSNLGFFNGTFVETFNALVTESGGVVTMAIEQSGGGDLTMRFSDGLTTFDCTPAATIVLTAGTDPSPTTNYVYIPQSTKVLTLSTSQWPSAEHIKVAYFLVPSATEVGAEGVWINQNWNDHRTGTDGQGHLSHMCETIRLTMSGATWDSGVAPDASGSEYLEITGASPSVVEFKSTAGVSYQMHKHTVPAIDMNAGADCHVVNWNGDAYHEVSDLADIVADAAGVSLSNKWFNLIFWGVANKTGEYAPLMCNLPSGSYVTQASAENDVDGHDVTTLPREFVHDSTTGFLICRVTCKQTPAGTWTLGSTKDLRGVAVGASAGSGGSGGSLTDFPDNQFTIFAVGDVTKILDFDLSGITTGTTRTVTPTDAAMTIPDTANWTDLTDAGDTSLHVHDIYLLADGTRELSSDWDAGPRVIRASQFYSDAAGPAAPFLVASSVVVTDLNADKLDGKHASDIDYSLVSGNDVGTDISAAELEELSDGSDTALHTHATVLAGYLPLTAGIGVPLTGDLYIHSASNPTLFLRQAGSVDDYGVIYHTGASLQVESISKDSTAFVQFNPKVTDGTSDAQFRMFRATNTTGDVGWRVYVGDGTSTEQHTFSASGGTVALCKQAGNLTVGGLGGSEQLSVIGDASFTEEIKLAYLGAAPASLANGMIWMESDGLHLYYAGAEKLVAGV